MNYLIVIGKIKKLFFKILCNAFTGKIISLIYQYKIPNIRYNNKRFSTPKTYCSDVVRAMIFFGFYESAELRLIAKYLNKQLPVVELGSSLGIVSSFVNMIIKKETPFIGIEANPYLISYIKENIQTHAPEKLNYQIIQAAVGYGNSNEVSMAISKNNTANSINTITNTGANIVQVKRRTLSDIVEQESTLICDIEGSEIEILQNDKQALLLCKCLFIELHKTVYENIIYEVEALKTLIEKDHGFKLIERDGNVFYFEKYVDEK